MLRTRLCDVSQGILDTDPRPPSYGITITGFSLNLLLCLFSSYDLLDLGSTMGDLVKRNGERMTPGPVLSSGSGRDTARVARWKVSGSLTLTFNRIFSIICTLLSLSLCIPFVFLPFFLSLSFLSLHSVFFLSCCLYLSLYICSSVCFIPSCFSLSLFLYFFPSVSPSPLISLLSHTSVIIHLPVLSFFFYPTLPYVTLPPTTTSTLTTFPPVAFRRQVKVLLPLQGDQVASVAVQVTRFFAKTLLSSPGLCFALLKKQQEDQVIRKKKRHAKFYHGSLTTLKQNVY